MPTQSFFQQRPFISLDRGAKIFGLAERHHGGGIFRGQVCRRCRCQPLPRHRLPGRYERIEDDVADRQAGVVPAIDRAFRYIAQFTDVARPGISFHLRHRLGVKARPAWPIQFRRHAPPEKVGQLGDIPVPRTQRRQGNHIKRQPVEKISAEPALIDHGGQMLIGGRDNAHINAHRLVRADACNLAIFNRTEQSFLRAR